MKSKRLIPERTERSSDSSPSQTPTEVCGSRDDLGKNVPELSQSQTHSSCVKVGHREMSFTDLGENLEARLGIEDTPSNVMEADESDSQSETFVLDEFAAPEL